MITRFAPSPTGYLHTGHAYAAWFANQMATPKHSMRLRIDDLDTTRSRSHFIQAIFDDLKWLGFKWQAPVIYQSKNIQKYQKSLNMLNEQDLLYPCFCTRSQIHQALEHHFQSAPHTSTSNKHAQPIAALSSYPGTCRHISKTMQNKQMKTHPYSLRLDMAKALKQNNDLYFHELGEGLVPLQLQHTGDPILARKDIGIAYHLAVVVDDAAQSIECITRADDLKPATHLHRLLQVLLQLPKTTWCHHRMICTPNGERLAKRNNPTSLYSLREQGIQPSQLWQDLNINII